MITFKGENTGSIMMFDGPALQLLRMMGTSGRRQGALMAEDVPEALASLESALAGAPKQPSPADDEDSERDPDEEPPVNLSQRAAPLLDLLRQAVATQSYVTWG